MKLVQLTDLFGNPIWMISTSFVVRDPIEKVHPKNAGAMIDVGGTVYAVWETPGEVVKKLKELE